MKDMTESPLGFDAAKKADELTEKLKRTFEEKGFEKAVIGLSGGLDSAVSAFLLVRALGKDNVKVFFMPYGSKNSPDAEEVARVLGVETEKIDISPMVDAYFLNYPDADKVRRGNKMARERMSILFDQSGRQKALVVGTGNRTEIDLGYFTLHGDGACSVALLASLYKTQVYKLAEHLGVPENVIKKAPSADLWEGQTDEEEIGVTYVEMDHILYYLDNGHSMEDIMAKGFTEEAIKIVREREEKNRFKMEGPVFF